MNWGVKMVEMSSFGLCLKTYKRHYLEINVKEMKHFDDHSRMKKM